MFLLKGLLLSPKFHHDSFGSVKRDASMTELCIPEHSLFKFYFHFREAISDVMGQADIKIRKGICFCFFFQALDEYNLFLVAFHLLTWSEEGF